MKNYIIFIKGEAHFGAVIGRMKGVGLQGEGLQGEGFHVEGLQGKSSDLPDYIRIFTPGSNITLGFNMITLRDGYQTITLEDLYDERIIELLLKKESDQECIKRLHGELKALTKKHASLTREKHMLYSETLRLRSVE